MGGLDSAEWRFVVTKTKTPHCAIGDTGGWDPARVPTAYGKARAHVPQCPEPRRPMSNNAVLPALRRLGIPKEEMSGQGFRAMDRTILDVLSSGRTSSSINSREERTTALPKWLSVRSRCRRGLTTWTAQEPGVRTAPVRLDEAPSSSHREFPARRSGAWRCARLRMTSGHGLSGWCRGGHLSSPAATAIGIEPRLARMP